MGPTGVGKTELLGNLKFNEPLLAINVDSVQIYKNLFIGCAKPTPFQKKRIDESYSAVKFYNDCASVLGQKKNIGQLPFFVGGTGLYFRAIEHGFSLVPPIGGQLRKKIELELKDKGLPYLYEKLRKIDPKLASTLHPHDKQRIMRGLEVFESTGRALSSFRSKERMKPLVSRPLKLVVFEPNKEIHHKNIEKRFNQMLEFGLINEVKTLLLRNPQVINSPGLRAIGYLQVIKYLTGVLSFTEMRSEAIQESKQLAKRQITWFKKERNTIWIESDGINDAIAKIMLELK
ncbi:tRNA (adenosine(37)-N6)-dimethylallyltransferase MiaA, partial [Pseudomonadota bacterium]|nr:tRNA (adenosine(37)-N6)-dimethylallyltransferase MiaA [Pseudomonadota bacterium]